MVVAVFWMCLHDALIPGSSALGANRYNYDASPASESQRLVDEG